MVVLDKTGLNNTNLYSGQGITAFENSLLSQVELPKGYEWTNPSLKVGEETVYSAKCIKDSGRNTINIAFGFEEILVNS